MRALVGWLLCTLSLAVAVARPAWAQSSPGLPYAGDAELASQLEATLDAADYDVHNERWNGLKTLVALAQGMRLQVDVRRDIDWEQLDAQDALLVLYPKQRVEPGHLASFIRNGGSVLIADDVGHSTEALGRLGMLRRPGSGVAARRFYRNHPFAPVATPLMPDHPLAASVAELVTNHPAVLTQVNGPEAVLGFGPEQVLVAAGPLGRGRFVALADPSVLINRMLQFEGNMQFAINLLQYLGRQGRATRLVLLVGDFDLYGEPTEVLDDGTMGGAVASLVGDANRWLDERNDYLLTPPGMQAVAVIMAALIALFVLLALPASRRAELDGAWTRPLHTSVPASSLEDVVRRYDQGTARGNYLLPATVLRDTANRVLARYTTDSDPLFTGPERDILAQVRASARPQAEAALARVYRRLHALPSRAQAASTWSNGYVSRRDFERLEHDVAALYLALGHEPR